MSFVLASMAGCGGSGGADGASAGTTAAAVAAVSVKAQLQGVPAAALAFRPGTFDYVEPSFVSGGFSVLGKVTVSADPAGWRLQYAPAVGFTGAGCELSDGCPGARRPYDLLVDSQRNLVRDLDGCTYSRDGAAVSLPTLPDVAQDGYQTQLVAHGLVRHCDGASTNVRAVFRGAAPIDWSQARGEAGQWEHIFVIDVLDANSGAQIFQLAAGINAMPVVSKAVIVALTQTDYTSGAGRGGKRLTLRMSLP